jgi:hypothetical protein
MSRSNDVDDLAVSLMMFALAIYLLIAAYVVLSMIAFVIAVYKYHKYRLEASKTYDEIATEVGANYLADDVLRTLYGLGIELADEGWDSPVDWLEGTLMGTGMEHD